MNTFGGELLHAVDLGDVSRFNDKRVLVVGAGNSGTDVLNHLVRHRPREVLVSVRDGPALRLHTFCENLFPRETAWRKIPSMLAPCDTKIS